MNNLRYSLKYYLKENLKGLMYKNRLKKLDNKYVFIHVPKCGGTYLRNQLNTNLNAYIDDWHEIKLKHLAEHQSAIICLRHPISRFESCFYSKLHMKKILNDQEKCFYEKFPTINVYINSLIHNEKETVLFSRKCNNVPMVGRYSSLKYWFDSTDALEKRLSKIKYIIKLENIAHDINYIYTQESIEPSMVNSRKNQKPKNKFTPIDEKYSHFLKCYLKEEFSIANYMLDKFHMPKYNGSISA